MLKILHLISSPYGLGGAEKLLLDMARFYDDKKFAVYYCNLFDSSEKAGLFSKALAEYNLPQLKVTGTKLHNLPAIVFQLLSLIKANDIDIVHAHLIHASIIGNIAGKFGKNHRTVVTQHYTQSAHNKFHLKKFDRIAVRSADNVIAVSSAVKNDLLSLGVKEQNIRVICNGINLTEFDSEAAKENSLLDELKKQGKYIIGTVGNLHKRKDHLTLVRAMETIVKKSPNAHLVIIGEGTERPVLEKALRESKLKKSVSLAGFQPSVPALLKNLDLYVHPSRFEPFGIAILEAMAARVGVIATKVDGVVDIIENESNGFLIPPQNPQTMAEYVCRAIENPARMTEMAIKGRKKVETHFRIENVVEEYQILYRHLCN